MLRIQPALPVWMLPAQSYLQHAHTLTLSSLIAVSPWLFNLSHQHTTSYNFSWVPLPCLTTTPFFPLFIGKLLKIFVCTFCVQLLPNSLFWLIANQAFITLQSTSAHCWIHVPCSLLICVDVAATSDVLLTLTWNTSQFHFSKIHLHFVNLAYSPFSLCFITAPIFIVSFHLLTFGFISFYSF